MKFKIFLHFKQDNFIVVEQVYSNSSFCMRAWETNALCCQILTNNTLTVRPSKWGAEYVLPNYEPEIMSFVTRPVHILIHAFCSFISFTEPAARAPPQARP